MSYGVNSVAETFHKIHARLHYNLITLLQTVLLLLAGEELLGKDIHRRILC